MKNVFMSEGELLISFRMVERETTTGEAKVKEDHNQNHTMEIRMAARTSMGMEV